MNSKNLLTKERREIFDSFMSLEEARGVSCITCKGTCCTYTANSMQITPLEALDIINYLLDYEPLLEVVLEEIHSSIKEFRLDKIFFASMRTSMRRYYTCPFYREGYKGCKLTRSARPYGCLSFNPRLKGIKEGGECFSNWSLLEDAFNSSQFEDLNQKLKKELKLDWVKLPIPVAIIEIWSKIY